jgi:F-type H+-transporting ATPase subunit delta
MARPTTAARRYAEAAFEVAVRDGTLDDWRRELDSAAAGLGDEAVTRGLMNPAIPLDAREQLVRQALGDRASRSVINLLLLLLRRGRLDLVPRVAAEFARLDDRRLGITHATATSADPLGSGEVTALTSRLEQLTGGRVALDLEVDPSIIGGLIVRVGDRLIDGSVRGRLERLRNRLVSGAL